MGGTAVRVLVAGCVIAAVIGVHARSASALAPPSTIPTITSPTDGATIAGFVTLSAASTAPEVVFYLDGLPFTSAVPVINGTASMQWETWGVHGGQLFLAAADCNDAGCGTPSVSISAVNADNPPKIVSPLNGTTTSTEPELSATVEGGSVEFTMDQVPLVVDTSPPFEYAVTSPLSVGVHIFAAYGCNTAGTVCSGPTSGSGFTVAVLHPEITSVSPAGFSPNGDGRSDSTRVSVSLPDPESITWTVKDAQGAIVQGPRDLGALSAGAHSFVWAGRDNVQQPVPDGRYTVLITTTGTVHGVALTGQVSTSVTVDTVRPSLGVPTGQNALFYPVHDGYHDTFTSKVSTDSGGTLLLVITTTAGHSVRVLKTSHSKGGSFSSVWNGLASSGHLVSAGTYHFRWDAIDAAGNLRSGHTYSLTVSLRYLRTESATLTDRAIDYDFVDGSASCAGGNTAQSAFRPNGLILVNACAGTGTQAAVAQYSYTVPAAISYSSIHVETYGLVDSPPAAVVSLIWNFARNDADTITGVTLSNTGGAWANLGSITATGHITSHRLVQIAIGLANFLPPTGYDMAAVRIVVTYKALV
jgi:flagellar hook assembly protein FlgD